MPKKILVVTGNRPEHFALIDALMETDSLCGAVLQIDTKHNTETTPFLEKYIEDKFNAVHRFFGMKYSHTSNLKTKPVHHDKINCPETIDFINSLAPDLLINFDTENFNNENIKKIQCEKWKIHEGFIEEFKGYDCNFWAVYNERPECVRHTIHILEDDKGSGDIIHISATDFRDEDTVQDMFMRSLRKMVNEIPKIIKKYNENKTEYKKQSTKGLFFKDGQMTCTHIEKIYKLFGNRYENIRKFKVLKP